MTAVVDGAGIIFVGSGARVKSADSTPTFDVAKSSLDDMG